MRTKKPDGYDRDFFKQKGAQGGKTTSKKYGKKHYQKMQGLSVASRKSKIA